MMVYTFLIGFLLSIAWFIAGGILYMNPPVANIYRKYEDHPGMKKWDNPIKYLVTMYLLGVLIPCMIFSFVFYFLSPIGILPFGLILVGVRIIPRLIDMWIQTSYPNKILAIELINGTILSFLASFLLFVLHRAFYSM